MKTIKHFQETFYPGIFVSDTYVKEVEKRDYLSVEQEQYATGFRFFDVAQTEIDGEVLIGDRQNISSFVYYGKRYTAEEVIAMYEGNPKYDALLGNIRNNDIKNMVICDNGQHIGLRDGDMTMEEVIEQSKKAEINEEVVHGIPSNKKI